MKIQYRRNNGYTYVLVIGKDYADMYYMDGTKEFPIMEDDHAAWMYLASIAPDIKYWSGADQEMEGDEAEQFLAWLDSDGNNCDICKAELQYPLFVLRDLEGYGNADPVCVSLSEARDLMRGWYAMDENTPEFADVWREATSDEIAKYGTSED